MPDLDDQQTPPVPEAGAHPGALGRRHLYRALTRPTRSQLVVAVLLGALGLAAVTQVRANDVSNAYAGYREQDLIDILNGLSTLSERTERQIESLETTRDELRSTRTSRQAALEQAQDNATNLSILAGRVPVTGPGVRVTIGTGVEQFVDRRALDSIQELRTAGAEAIEFNDSVRIVAQSAFEVSGSGILIDGELVPAPYVVDAIGDPETLAGAITFSRGPQEVIESRGGTVRIEQRPQIDVESTTTPSVPEFSVPD